jgi:putative membrane protein
MIYTLIINSIAVYITAKILDGVEVKDFVTAIVVAIVLALVNTFIKPVIIFLTLPVTVITLGLFILVINALMILLVDKLMEDFKVRDFWWALLFGIALSVVNAFLFWIF